MDLLYILVEFSAFANTLKICRNQKKEYSVFSQWTEEASAAQYFQFYGCISQQQNMMQDFVRTATYHRAILQNHTDFRDKVIPAAGYESHAFQKPFQDQNQNETLVELPYDPAIPLLVIHLKELKQAFKYLYTNVHNSIIQNSQKVETVQMPIN
nr:histone-arginine methyltransferase CARM1-like [Macaca fascicularis]